MYYLCVVVCDHRACTYVYDEELLIERTLSVPDVGCSMTTGRNKYSDPNPNTMKRGRGNKAVNQCEPFSETHDCDVERRLLAAHRTLGSEILIHQLMFFCYVEYTPGTFSTSRKLEYHAPVPS